MLAIATDPSPHSDLSGRRHRNARRPVNRYLVQFLLAATVIVFASGTVQYVSADSPQGQKSSGAGIEFFETRIRPVLVKHCYRCHSAEAKSSKGGLMLDTRAGTRQGGESGPAVVSGEVDESLLIDAIRHQTFQMPPDGNLPENVIADFVKWVELGAPDPRDGVPIRSQSTDGASEYWAFQPPRRSQIPEVEDDDWPATPIDQFVLAKMEAAGLAPVTDADRRSLVRRIYFDLIGLPPTPEQVESFVSDAGPTQLASERLVNQLLDSHHFGERWGRHWLDLARFAESTGKEWNWAHPEAWRYRDYVIESFNEDKPYDQFLTEQIAGDLLPAADERQRDEQLMATGFLAVGPKAVSIANDEEFRLELADEQINAVSRAVLGLTVGCARCHDHKFDPIPIEDYYALTGIFLSTQTLFGTSASGFKGRNNKQGTPLLPIGPGAERLQQQVLEYEKRLGDLSNELTEKRDSLKKLVEERTDEQSRRHETGRQEQPGDLIGQQIAALQQQIEKQEQELEQLEQNPPAKPDYAMGARDRADPQDCKVRLGGEIDQLGDSVPRGFLTALNLGDELDVNAAQSGRRELARWLTHPGNPLTARVMVNRIWQHLFGRGLVPTVDNFGLLGERPTHPQLLDHLAISFVENEWSLKQMIRRIVLSRTYRLSTLYDSDAVRVDPDNELLWRMTPRRLEAEEIRDAILAISGSLERNPLQGSPAVARLDVGWVGNEVKEPAFKNYDHRHRSVYLPIVRDQVPEMLQTFDFPDPVEVTGQRDVSVSPAQALYLMNSEFVIARAREAAEQMLYAEDVSESDRIDWVYQRVLGRPPAQEERQRDEKMIEDVDRILQKRGIDSLAAQRDGWATLFQSLFSSGEFLFLF
jgi:hypothetical protein